MKNPSGYGTVAKLSGNRRRPFIVKKVTGWKENGQPIYEIIGYTATREEGNILLAQYNHNPWDVGKAVTTLQELFEAWEKMKAPKMNPRSRATLKTAYRHIASLASSPYKQIKAYQMQGTIDSCLRGYSTQGTIKTLWWHLDRLALELDISSNRYSELLTSAPIPPTSRVPFSPAEIERLWQHQHKPWVDTVLILLYSGWRIGELLALTQNDIDLNAGTMKGGEKTAAGKGRVVPIHPNILPFIEAHMTQGSQYLISHLSDGARYTLPGYRYHWNQIMTDLGMNHVPHECRHTFESALDSVGANRRCIDLLMGHASRDVGNRVYNHKTIDELREAVQLIQY